MIFNLPTNHVRRILPYNIRFLGVILDLPTLKSDIVNGRSLGCWLAGMLDKDSENEEGSLPACVQPPGCLPEY